MKQVDYDGLRGESKISWLGQVLHDDGGGWSGKDDMKCFGFWDGLEQTVNTKIMVEPANTASAREWSLTITLSLILSDILCTSHNPNRTQS